MASFQKRGKTWQYTVSRMVNGESAPIRKGGFRTKKEAQVAAAEVEEKLRKGITPHLKLEPFNAYLTQWVELYKSGVSEGTLTNYKNTIRIVDEHFSVTPIQHIKKSDYQLFLNKFGEDNSLEYAKKVNSHIRACVLEAIDEGVIHVDFTRSVVLTGKKGKKSSEKHMNYLESKRFNKHLRKKIEDEKRPVLYLLALAFASGMRFSELIALNRKDFNFKEGLITISKARGYSTNTGGGERNTKTISSERTIRINKKTMDLFNDFFETTPNNIHDLVFYNPSSKYKVYSNTGVNKALKKILNEINIEPISVHGLRHTHASISLYKDVSIQYISERLGHADVDTTIREYAHLIKEMKKRDEKKTMDIFEAI